MSIKITARHDGWDEKQDKIVLDTVLKHYSEGGTQIAGYEEAGEKLGRTAGACGFRFNSLLRYKYKKRFEEAKKQRLEWRKAKGRPIHQKAPEGRSGVVTVKKEQTSEYKQALYAVLDQVEWIAEIETEIDRLHEEYEKAQDRREAAKQELSHRIDSLTKIKKSSRVND